MTKANMYLRPLVAVLGSADSVTHGLPFGTIAERAPVGHPTWTSTTHALLDL
jgi:hypothetical protein